MITYLKCNNGYQEIHQWKSGCWIRVTSPTDDELTMLSQRFDVPGYFIHDAEDAEERPRVDHEENWLLVFVRVPCRRVDDDGDVSFATAPLAILLRDDVFITVSYFDNEMLDDFVAWSVRKRMTLRRSHDLLLSLMLSSSVWYLKYLKQMNAMMVEVESRLEEKMENEELMRLMGLGKYLVYFTTSLRGNTMVLARLKNRLRHLPIDTDLLEDVEIETQQALDTTAIYTDIIDKQQASYSAVIGNNLNHIMKTLTIVTILLMIPTGVAGFYGMNVPNGMEEWPFGFLFSLLLSAVLVACGYFLLKHNNYFSNRQ